MTKILYVNTDIRLACQKMPGCIDKNIAAAYILANIARFNMESRVLFM